MIRIQRASHQVPAMSGPGVLLAVVLATTACDGVGTSNVSIDDLPQLVAEPTMRIGSLDDAETGFSRIAYVDLDRDGNLYVGEGMDTQIRVYSPDGRLLRRIGGQGKGPGEFDGLPRFGVHGDTVWAYDNSARRITLFSRAGELLSTAQVNEVRIPLPSGYGWVMPWSMRPDGRFSSDMMRLSFYRPDEDHPQVAHSANIPVPRVVFDLNGAVVDTVGWDPSPNPRMYSPPSPERESRYQRIEIGGRNFSVPDPPLTGPQWHTLNQGRLILDMDVATSAEHATFSVTRRALSGDTVFSREYQYTPVPYAEADLDSIAARAARGAAGGGVPYSPGRENVPHDVQVVRNRLREAMKFPGFHLPIRFGWVDQEERLWLTREQPEGEAPRYVVLGTDGTPLGEVGLPAGTRLWYASGDVVWTSQPDELDVPWLTSYRVSGLGPLNDR